ncbi:hypothetical protein ABIF64_000433 [Bradyrhizobium japonicum]|uniref:Uncharacterized protein n=1 Tax=Bradyrhizobium japonicum TaxID=375 RepID=A0ABV2RX48_BRAJP|nr:hypothetical protein [Bradyrhizobium japonicum]UQD95998.1 hypothetical protein JEY30_31110 [Bradyrhizobium japonicum]WLB16135.1 hypothetical protein QIH95_29315 [Bradyrhizobium japonicum]
MCDNVTDVIRRACAEPFFGRALVDRIIWRIRHRLEVDPQPTITFELFFGEAAEPTNIRVAFLRQDWEHLLSTLEIGDCGTWSEETLLYRCDLFDVCANAAENEVLVIFW